MVQMTETHAQERIPAKERIAIRCVDSDVHPVPKRGEITPYIPEPWRSKFFLDHKIGELIYYDAPDYAHAFAMRTDTFPPDGVYRKPTRRIRAHSTIGRTITGSTATTTGTSVGAGRSASPSRTRKARSNRSRSGRGTRTWPRS
jgi:hypothetical protein